MANLAINAGELDKRVQLRTMTQSLDANRGVKMTPTVSTKKYWAGIKPTAGREVASADRLMSGEITHMIRMRYMVATVALKPKDAIVYGSRVFEIVSKINPEERNVCFDFLCKEVVTN